MSERTREQEEAFEKFDKLKVGAAFMKMGTGKTKLALDLMDSKKSKVDMFLWICPCSLKNEIEAERKKWYPDMDIEIVGCESIGSSNRIFLQVLAKMEGKKVFTVVDESLKIKNSQAKRTQRILEIGKRSEYRFILNGTPVSKNILDLWTQMEFLSHKILKMSYYQFKFTFCKFETQGKFAGVVKDTTNIPYLMSIIEPYIYQCDLKIDTIKDHKTIYYSLNDIRQYKIFKDSLFDKYYDEESDDLNFYAFSSVLQKYYCQNSNKNEIIDRIINKTNEKTIIFVKYIESIPKDAEKIVGGTSSEDRAKIIERFKNGEFKALWLTYGVGAYGLNLQFCKQIIFAEQSWDYAEQAQAEARIFRLGQGKQVTYYHLLCGNVGLEEMISKSLDRKDNLLYNIKQELTRQNPKALVAKL